MATNNVGNDATNGLKKAAECFDEASKDVKKQAQVFSDNLEGYIKECPFKSALIASAIGLLVGKFLI